MQASRLNGSAFAQTRLITRPHSGSLLSCASASTMLKSS
jgi:hypothetical protein